MAITVHQKFYSAKENIVRCNFYAYENLLPNYSREYFYKVKTKKEKALRKNSLYYTEKNSRFVRVFCKILYTLFTFHFTIAKKYPSITRRKNSVLLMCFERKFTNYFIKTKILTVFVDEDSLPVALFLQLTKKFVFVL